MSYNQIMDQISIRQMELDDYEQVQSVDILTQRQYLGSKFDDMSQEEQESHLVSRKSEFQTNIDTGYCFVAEHGEKIVGFILAYETLPFAGTLNIRYVGINPIHQREGIGQLLYKELINKARENGIKKIQALINLDNPNSIKLHEKVEFKLVDRKEATLILDK